MLVPRLFPIKAFLVIYLGITLAEEARPQTANVGDDFPGSKLWSDRHNWRLSPLATAGSMAAVVLGCMLLLTFIFACVIWCCQPGSATGMTEPLVQPSRHETTDYAVRNSAADHLPPRGFLPCGQPWSQAPFYQQPYLRPEPQLPAYLVPTADSLASMPPPPPPYDYKGGGPSH